MVIDSILSSLVLIVGCYILFFIGKIVHDRIHHEYDLTRQLVEEDNPAISLAIAGYYLGLVLCIGGAVVGPSNGIAEDIIDLFLYGIMSIALLNVSWLLCDKIILHQFRITDELIRDRNQGTGAVSCGMSIASGVIIFGAISGEGGSIWTAMGFWIAGQLLLVVVAIVYNMITPYDIHTEIEKDNVAAGISFGGALAAMGIIVGLTAAGDFETWSEDLIHFLWVSIFGLVLLPVIRFLTDKMLLPTVRLSDEIAGQETPNIGAAYIEAFSYIGAAFIISWCV